MPLESASFTRLLARIPVLCRLRDGLKRVAGLVRAGGAGQSRAVGSPAAATVATGQGLPASRRQAAGSGSALAPMNPDRVHDARQSLRRILDCHPAAPAIWPSIALVDRSMRRHGGVGIERLSPQVLQDAARVLNRLMDEVGEHGVVVLLERIDRVLRVVHGSAIPADMPWQAVRPDEIQVLESSITEFMEIERAWEERRLAEDDGARRALAA